MPMCEQDQFIYDVHADHSFKTFYCRREEADMHIASGVATQSLEVILDSISFKPKTVSSDYQLLFGAKGKLRLSSSSICI